MAWGMELFSEECSDKQAIVVAQVREDKVLN